MKKRLVYYAIVWLLLAGSQAGALDSDGQCYAIRAGKILTMASRDEQQTTPQVINHGIILVRAGKIEALDTKDTLTIPKDIIVREFGAMKVAQAFNPERGPDLGHSRMAMSWLLYQFLDIAKAYHDEWIAFEQGKTDQKPEHKPQWENLRKIFNKEIPTIVHTCAAWGVMQTVRMFNDNHQL